MKKTLSILAILGVVGVVGMQTANAFSWSNLNPFNWGRCNKCEKVKPDCGCPKVNPCPCQTGAAAPCDPCNRHVTQPVPCDACDRLQQQMAK